MISFVVPVFNMEQFLPRCMDKLLNQKGDFEIILVDDGSEDGSGSLCDSYAMKSPERVRVIHKENGGLSSARNVGIDEARGEYVIFPDPDDWTEPNFAERLQLLQEQYSPDLLCTGHYVDFDNHCIPANEGQSEQHMNGIQARRALLISPCISGFAWNKLFNINIIRNNNLRFLDDVGTTEDLDFAFRYLQYCEKVVFFPEDRLYHYYQRSGAATHSGFSVKKLQSVKTYEKIIENSDDEVLIRAAQEEICNTCINLIWSYQESGSNDIESWKRMREYLGRYLKCYYKSNRYSTGRKVQAVLAYYSPKLYAGLKKRISNDNTR